MRLEKLTKDDFLKCLNQRFRIHVAEQEPLEAELIEVRGLVPADEAPDRREPFSVVFRGSEKARLQQGVFHLENDTLGEVDLFLVTIGPDEEGLLRHEAVFT